MSLEETAERYSKKILRMKVVNKRERNCLLFKMYYVHFQSIDTEYPLEPEKSLEMLPKEVFDKISIGDEVGVGVWYRGKNVWIFSYPDACNNWLEIIHPYE